YQPHRETKKERKTIAFVGRFSGFKGDTLLLLVEKIFPEVIRCYPEVEIHIVGGMSEQEKIVHAAEKFNAQAGKRFIVIEGFSRNVQEAYRRADLVIGSGRVAMEALACGSLVVSIGESNVVGLITEKTKTRALVTNFGDLDIRKPINVEESVAEILTALRNPGIVPAGWGRAFIADYFDVKNIIQKLDLMYASLLQ
ncbi:MAG: glycosyltransferase, partial [Bacteroidota bacterium]